MTAESDETDCRPGSSGGGGDKKRRGGGIFAIAR